ALLERGFNLVSGGTDNHLMLVDLRSKNITGKDFEIALDAANITCNKNAIPNDPQKPGITSGVRLGTPAVTTRGLNKEDMIQVAEAMTLIADDAAANTEKAKAIVKALTDKYPLYK
ncbi:MAG: serine hydroxymethyltransferase, partial [Lachnospiraceae bacterium]|nr:serine hydroxymethyltransferase [Lachnospiraceae bacterium]